MEKDIIRIKVLILYCILGYVCMRCGVLLIVLSALVFAIKSCTIFYNLLTSTRDIMYKMYKIYVISFSLCQYAEVNHIYIIMYCQYIRTVQE